jgi:hypothetical protein
MALFVSLLGACKPSKKDTENNPPPAGVALKGFSFYQRINAIWGGPVNSYHLGLFPEWVVDMRAISEAQTSSKNELDAQNDIFMGFFNAKRGNDSLVIFRNGGYFQGMQRISYLKCDSERVTPTSAYYRFVDLNAGAARLYSTFLFKGDSLIMETYSRNVFHERWSARRRDSTKANAANLNFGFPKRTIVRDMTNDYVGRADAVAFSYNEDVYPESAMPYLGKINLTVTKSSNVTVTPSSKVLVLLTTKSIFNGGFVPNYANLDLKSRYVVIPGWNGTGSTGFTFNYAHPGTLYLNVVLDKNGNNIPDSGDFLAFAERDKLVTLAPLGTTNVSSNIDTAFP